jgi:hypothetical protein
LAQTFELGRVGSMSLWVILLLMVIGSASTLLLGPNVDALLNLVYG